MKSLKYIIFAFVIGFMTLSQVSAKVEKYDNISNAIVDNLTSENITTLTDYASENILIANDVEFNADTFCDGPVQGAFTTIGWVFFFLKILIPIILIVLGSVDFGKAVLSSKDDEIKKSAKTLVMRAIAGVIIFFIPTIIDFIVELIGGDDLYNGTFATCTHCMLEPTDDACRRLIGD